MVSRFKSRNVVWKPIKEHSCLAHGRQEAEEGASGRGEGQRTNIDPGPQPLLGSLRPTGKHMPSISDVGLKANQADPQP